MKSILDKNFKYVNSDHSDIRKTFARIRKEQKNTAPVSDVQKKQPFNIVINKNFG